MDKFYSICSIILFMFLSKLSYAEQPTHSDLIGSWKLTKFLGAGGAYSEGSEERAREILGKSITVEKNGDLALYNGSNCKLSSVNFVELIDDRATFGSAGGSWHNIGIEPLPGSSYAYSAKSIEWLCQNDPDGQSDAKRTVLYTNKGDLVLLNLYETWIRIEQIEQE